MKIFQFFCFSKFSLMKNMVRKIGLKLDRRRYFRMAWHQGLLGTSLRPWAVRGQGLGITRTAGAIRPVRAEGRHTARFNEKLCHSVDLPSLFFANA